MRVSDDGVGSTSLYRASALTFPLLALIVIASGCTSTPNTITLLGSTGGSDGVGGSGGAAPDAGDHDAGKSFGGALPRGDGGAAVTMSGAPDGATSVGTPEGQDWLCHRDAECPSDVPHCYLAKECVACFLDAHCATGYCDTGSHSCTGCVRDADCTPGTAHCDDDLRRCVQCSSAADCPSGQVCAAEAHSCRPPCLSAADCVGIDRQLCSATGVCVQCEADADCATSTGTPRCNLRTGVCVQCVTQSDCGPAVCLDDCLTCSNYKCVWHT